MANGFDVIHDETAHSLALGLRQIASLSALVGFFGPDRTPDGSPVFGVGPNLPNPVEHEPCCLLSDSDISLQLHAPDVKTFPLVRTRVWHRFAVESLPSAEAPAITTTPVPIPKLLLEPLGSGDLIG